METNGTCPDHRNRATPARGPPTSRCTAALPSRSPRIVEDAFGIDHGFIEVRRDLDARQLRRLSEYDECTG